MSRPRIEKNTGDEELLQPDMQNFQSELADAIIHEINNPLTMILGRACQIEMALSGERALDEKNLLSKVKDIKFFSERMIDVVTSLRSLTSTGMQQTYGWTTVEKLISDSVNFCREKFGDEGIKLQVNSPSETVRVYCQPILIQSVILNLLENAKDAVLSSENFPRLLELRAEVSEENVTFAVRDNGTGVTDELREKIFLPFVTSKPFEKGTGLGLSISKRIVEEHRGSIWFESVSGATTFYFHLPIGLTSGGRSFKDQRC